MSSDDRDALVDRLRRERDAREDSERGVKRRAQKLHRQAELVARHEGLRGEAMRRLSDTQREDLLRQSRLLHEAKSIVEHLYAPWFDDRGLVDAIRLVERHLGEAARSGDGSAPPPDLEGVRR